MPKYKLIEGRLGLDGKTYNPGGILEITERQARVIGHLKAVTIEPVKVPVEERIKQALEGAYSDRRSLVSDFGLEVEDWKDESLTKALKKELDNAN